MVSLLGLSSFPLAIALKISNVNDMDLLPVISPRLSSPCGGGESDSNPGKVPRPTEVWRRPRRRAVCWRGPLLSARNAFVSSIEEAGGLR